MTYTWKMINYQCTSGSALTAAMTTTGARGSSATVAGFYENNSGITSKPRKKLTEMALYTR